jgi:putative Holliday junction resolvase
MRIGRRLAVDVGRVRLGIALCDQEGILASPLDAVTRSAELSETISSLANLLETHGVIEVYVGDPLSLSGKETDSTSDARSVAAELSQSISIPVRLIDERLTTVTAATKLRASGISAKDSKSIIDSASAVEILESALRIEKRSGVAPGVLVGDSVGA